MKAWTDFVHAILSKNYLKAWTDFVERTLMTVLYKMITLARCFLFKVLACLPQLQIDIWYGYAPGCSLVDRIQPQLDDRTM